MVLQHRPGTKSAKTMTLTWLVILILTTTNILFIETRINIALNTQTGIAGETGNEQNVGFAVDGNIGGNFYTDRCTNISPHGPSKLWWMTMLKNVYKIDSVRIYPRTDCCNDLRDIDVRVVDERNGAVHLCTSIADLVPAGGQTYICTQPVEGTEVALVTRTAFRRSIFLCEFQVFGEKTRDAMMPVNQNFALMKTVRTSALSRGIESSRRSIATDGLLIYRLRLERNESSQWLLIDLQNTFHVGNIIAFMLRYCCDPTNVDDFIVYVTNKDPEMLKGFPDKLEIDSESICKHMSSDDVKSTFDFSGYPEKIHCDQKVIGRYVLLLYKTRSPDRILDTLTVGEIQIMADPAAYEMGIAEGKENLALGKPTSQSSTGLKYLYSNYAVDGILYPDWLKTHCAATSNKDTDPWTWWMVDLEGIFTVEGLRIYYTDHDLYDIDILVIHDDLVTTKVCRKIVTVIPSYNGYTVQCTKPIVGRYVKIARFKKNKSWLVLCEIQVFGSKMPETTMQIENYAFKKSVFHSTIDMYSIHGSTAVDGIFSAAMNLHRFCVKLRGSTQTQWMIIDLRNIFVVDTIRVALSYDYSEAEQSLPTDGFSLAVTTEDPRSLPNFPQEMESSTKCKTLINQKFNRFPETVKCEKPLAGRYVWLLVKSSTFVNLRGLVICEIEVYPVYPPRILNSKQTNSDDDKDKENGLLWRFKLISQKGSQAMINDLKSQRHMTHCARNRVRDKKDIRKAPFIQVDLPSGNCRFLEDPDESEDSDSSHWVVYELE